MFAAVFKHFLGEIYGSFIDYIDFLQGVLGIIGYENDRILIAELASATIIALIYKKLGMRKDEI